MITRKRADPSCMEFVWVWCLRHALVLAAAHPERQGADDHAEACERKTVLRTVDVADLSTDCCGEERTDVDADVEDGETRVTSWVTVLVKFADNGGDVRFEITVADDDGTHADVEPLLRAPQNHEFPDGHQNSSEDDGVFVAQDLVCNPTAQNRRSINQSSVCPINAERFHVTHGQRFDQIQREQRAHAIVAEALPHLGEKQGVQTLRMAFFSHN